MGEEGMRNIFFSLLGLNIKPKKFIMEGGGTFPGHVYSSG